MFSDMTTYSMTFIKGKYWAKLLATYPILLYTIMYMGLEAVTK